MDDFQLGFVVAARHDKRALTFPREFYLPSKLRGVDPINPRDTDLYVWTWEEEVNGKTVPYGIAFVAKQKKPYWNYRFRTTERRDKQIEESTKERKRFLEEKERVKKEKREFEHGLVEGDILSASWGYDQTNVNFYQIIETKGKHVILREIGKKVVSGGVGSDKVTPAKGKFIGPPMRRKPTGRKGWGARVKIESSISASKWDGRPMHQTAFGYGH